jgi:hypothetical protein
MIKEMLKKEKIGLGRKKSSDDLRSGNWFKF